MDLSSALCSGSVFRPQELQYGLPLPAFTFVESLLWFAQAQRSGVWTYFESTPPERQAAMLQTLESNPAPAGFAEHYALGMNNGKDVEKLDVVDLWIRAHDVDNNAWLWRIADEHRALFEALCAQEASVG